MTSTYPLMTAASPLSDCTVALDNAENILSNYPTGAAYKARKPFSPSVSLCGSLSFSSRLSPLSLAKPMKPASPLRHDPYSPCVAPSAMSPHDSFYASYVECAAVTNGSAAASKERPAPAAPGCAVPAPRSAAARQQSQPQPQSQPSALPQDAAQTLSDKSTAASLHLSNDGGATSVDSSLNGSSCAEPAAATPATPNRTVVVRKVVVGCAIDRTTGRPIPVKRR